jgi:sugar lactone lactonase YvrE
MVISASSTPSRARLALRLGALTTAALTTATLVTPPGQAAAPERRPLPRHITLPAGFQPEGIAIRGKFAYLGSRAAGEIRRVNLKTGKGQRLISGPGTPSLGMKVDGRHRLFVAGGTGGDARVISTRTRKIVRHYQLTTPEGAAFVNDVILSKRAAWFTDSTQQQLYRGAIGPQGKLGAARTIPLRGQWKQVEGNNANGIATTPDHHALLVINSTSGILYRVDGSGRAVALDAGGPLLTNGDGLWREGRTLYVVQNRLDKIVKLRLNKAGTTVRVVGARTSSDFDVPTTIARYRGSFYLPNARFTTTPTETTHYWITRIRVKR